MKRAPYLLAATTLACLTLINEAKASSIQLMEQNASGLGNAYAGQAAAAENASTIFSNPAGMTQLPGAQVSGALAMIKPSFNFTDSGASQSPIPGVVPLGTNGGDAGHWAAIPAAYLSWAVGHDIWLGVGLTVPFGLATDYDSAFMGRFQSQQAQFKTYDVNPSIAWKANEVVSLGVGVSYQYAQFKFNSAQLVAVPVVGRAHLYMDDAHWGWNAGILFNLPTRTRIGLSYRAAVKHDFDGDFTISGVPGVGAISAPVAMSIKLPDTLSLGVAQSLGERWTVLADYTYTHWSTMQSVPIDTTAASGLGAAGTTLNTLEFHFKDTYRVGLGANYQWSDKLMLKAGIAYDESPVTEQYRLVALPDSNHTYLTIGAKYAFSTKTTLDIGYGHVFMAPSSVHQARGTQGTVDGDYHNRADIISAQLSYSF